MSRTFALYPEERTWWSFNDYGAVLDVMTQRRPRRVLEFGPGSSTLALLEGGAEHIDSCEDDPVWFGHHAARLAARFPDRVTLCPYACIEPVQIAGLDWQRYDLALVDGPRDTTRRPLVINYALARCDAVLVPVDGSGPLREFLVFLSTLPRLDVAFTPTGPLAGEFALVTRC